MTQEKYDIDASKAIDALDKVAKKATDLGDAIVRLNKVQGTYEKNAAGVLKAFKDMRDASKIATSAIGLSSRRITKTGEVAKELTGAFRSLRRTVDTTETSIKGMVTALGSLVSVHISSATAAASAKKAADLQAVSYELLSAAVMGSTAGLSKEAQQYMENQQTLERLRESMKALKDDFTTLVGKEREASQVMDKLSQIQRVYAAVSSGTTAALKNEDKQFLNTLTSKAHMSRLQKEVNTQLNAGQVAADKEARSIKNSAEANRILAAVLGGTVSSLSREEQQIVRNMQSAISLAQAKSQISRSQTAGLRTQNQEADAVAKATRVANIYTAVMNGTTSTLRGLERAEYIAMQTAIQRSQAQTELKSIMTASAKTTRDMAVATDLHNRSMNAGHVFATREAQIIHDSTMAAERKRRALRSLIEQEYRLETQRRRQAATSEKLRLSEELLAAAHSRSGRATSAEAQRVIDNMRAQQNLARATEILKARMEGKNVALDRQGRLITSETRSASQLAGAYENLGRILRRVQNILINTVGYGNIFLLLRTIRQSVNDAYDWSRAISEIRTISDRAAVSTDQWRVGLSRLSSAYGVSTVEAAEAAYQALSDQVVEGADAFTYLREQMNLARVAVSTLDDAAQITSATINAFGLSTAEASRINAIYFATVDYGRIRLDEIAQTMGRVSILSDQLGISLTEQNAALSLLTRKGIPAHEGMTLLRNVMQKLIRPTEHMELLLRNWGFTSGAAAVKTLGLVGVMQRFADHANGTSDMAKELGEMFGRMRAQIGAAGLTTGEFNEELDKFKNSPVKYIEALEERMSSLDVKVDRARETLRNFFVNVFGQNLLLRFVQIVDATNNANTMLVRLARTVGNVGVFLLASRIYRGLVGLIYDMAVAFTRVRLGSMGAAAGMTIFTQSVTRANLAMFAISATLGLVTSYFASASIQAATFGMEVQAAGADAVAAFDIANQMSLAKMAASLDQDTTKVEEALKNLSNNYHRIFTNIRQTNYALQDSIKDTWNNVNDDLEKSLSELSKTLTKYMREQQRNLDEMDRRAGKFSNIEERRTVASFDKRMAQIGNLSAPGQVDALKKLMAEFETAALQALSAGNEDSYQLNSQLQDRAIEELMRVYEQMKDDNKGIKTQRQVTDRQGRPVFDRQGRPKMETIKRDNILGVEQAEKALRDLEQDKNALIEYRLKLEEQHQNKLNEQLEKEREALELKQEQAVELEKVARIIQETEISGTPEELNALAEAVTKLKALGGTLGVDVSTVAGQGEQKIALGKQEMDRRAQEESLNQTVKNFESLFAELEQNRQKENEARKKSVNFFGGELPRTLSETVAQIGVVLQRSSLKDIPVLDSAGLTTADGSPLPPQPKPDFFSQFILDKTGLGDRNQREDEVRATKQVLGQLVEDITLSFKNFNELDADAKKEALDKYDELRKRVELIDDLANRTIKAGGSVSGFDPRQGSFLIGDGLTTIKDLIKKLDVVADGRDEVNKGLKEADTLRQEQEVLLQKLNNRFNELPEDLKKLIDVKTITPENMNDPAIRDIFINRIPQLLQDLKNKQSSNVSVGDINITMPIGTTNDQVQEFAAVLKRALRHGLIS